MLRSLHSIVYILSLPTCCVELDDEDVSLILLLLELALSSFLRDAADADMTADAVVAFGMDVDMIVLCGCCDGLTLVAPDVEWELLVI